MRTAIKTYHLHQCSLPRPFPKVCATVCVRRILCAFYLRAPSTEITVETISADQTFQATEELVCVRSRGLLHPGTKPKVRVLHLAAAATVTAVTLTRNAELRRGITLSESMSVARGSRPACIMRFTLGQVLTEFERGTTRMRNV